MEPPRYVVRVSGKTHDGASFSGTGFLVSEEGHVATCWHVVAQAAEINVHLPFTEPWLYRISAKVDSDDLALLALVAKASLRTPFAPLHGNWREDSQIGNSVTVWGCSTAQYYTAPRYIPCTIGSFSEQHGRIGLSGDINSGDSGAPVVNAAGKVIGIANARDRNNAGHAMAIPISLLLDLLQRAGVRPMKDSGPSRRPADSVPTLLSPTPPAPPPHFTGREAELDRLSRLLTSGDNIAHIALYGMGGIGKTAFALKLAERMNGDFPGGILWWSLGPQPDVLTALDVWVRYANPQADLSAIPEAASRAHLVRSMLVPFGKLCVILDDVWQVDLARLLMSAVPPGCPIVITTRDGDLAKRLRCQLEPIGRLSADEAITVLAKLLGALGDQEAAARDIASLTESHPLALELIAGLADSLADLPLLAGRLREKPALDLLRLPGGEVREENMEACLALSYAALDAEMQRRLRALGVFAPAPFDRAAILAVWGEEDEETLKGTVRHLTRRNLLTQAASAEEYQLHSLLRAYALALLERVGEHDTVARRHADHYGQFAVESGWRAIESAYEQIDWGWRWVQNRAPDRILAYVSAIDGFLAIRGRSPQRLAVLNRGLRQAETENDRRTEGTLLNNIGAVYNDLGRKAEALDHYRQALAIYREGGDRRGEGTTLNNIGGVYDDLGRKAEALDHYQQALAIRREVGDRGGESTTLNNIGSVYTGLGRKAEALDHYQQALAIRREVGDRWGESVTLFNIGTLLDQMGHTREAVTYLERNVALDEVIGHPDLGNDRVTLEAMRRRLRYSDA